MTPQAAGDFCRAAGLDHRAMSLDEIRVAYLRRLREKAAGRSSDGEFDLTTERARLAHHQANIAALDEDVKRKTLIPADLVKQKWQDMQASARAKLLSLPTKVAASCVGLPEIQIEATARGIVNEALDELARGNGAD